MKVCSLGPLDAHTPQPSCLAASKANAEGPPKCVVTLKAASSNVSLYVIRSGFRRHVDRLCDIKPATAQHDQC